METTTKLILPSSVDHKTNGLLVQKKHGKELIESETYQLLQKTKFKPEVLNWSSGKAFASKWKNVVYTCFVAIFVVCLTLLSMGKLSFESMFFIQILNVIFLIMSILSLSFRGKLNNEISKEEYEGIRLLCIYHKPTLEYVSAQMKQHGMLIMKDLMYIDFYNRYHLAQKLLELDDQIVERQKIRQMTANML